MYINTKVHTRIRPRLKPAERQRFNERIDFSVVVVYGNGSEVIFSATIFSRLAAILPWPREFCEKFSLSRNRSTVFSARSKYREWFSAELSVFRIKIIKIWTLKNSEVLYFIEKSRNNETTLIHCLNFTIFVTLFLFVKVLFYIW